MAPSANSFLGADPGCLSSSPSSALIQGADRRPPPALVEENVATHVDEPDSGSARVPSAAAWLPGPVSIPFYPLQK
jgi:hypothetical protein